MFVFHTNAPFIIFCEHLSRNCIFLGKLYFTKENQSLQFVAWNIRIGPAIGSYFEKSNKMFNLQQILLFHIKSFGIECNCPLLYGS